MDTLDRPTRTLTSHDELYSPGSDLPTTSSDYTISDLVDEGVESLPELEVLRLPADTVEALSDVVSELSDESIGILQEASSRGRFYGLFAHSTERGNAWWDLGRALQKEVIDRYDDRNLSLVPSYVTEDGTETESLAYDRLLRYWVVELQITPVKDENKRNPTVRTVTAKVTEQLPELRAATAPWNSPKSFAHCWKLSGIGEDEGQTFALSKMGYKDSQVMLWTHDEFADEWDNPSHVYSVKTWPSQRTYMRECESIDV